MTPDQIKAKILEKYPKYELVEGEVELDFDFDDTEPARHHREDLRALTGEVNKLAGLSGTFRVVKVISLGDAAELLELFEDEDQKDELQDTWADEEEFVVVPPDVNSPNEFETSDYRVCLRPAP